MNAIDTNILVRLIVQDDEEQSKKALNFIKKQGVVFISTIVLCEFSWVCLACYDFNKKELYKALEHILRTDQFKIENSDSVWGALHEFHHSQIDFSDCLIGSISKHNDCEKVVTFDKKATHSDFFELLR